MRPFGIHGSPLLIGLAGIGVIGIGLLRGRPEALVLGAVIIVLGVLRAMFGR